MRRGICLLLAIFLLGLYIPAIAEKMVPGIPLQICHQVSATKEDITQKNKSVIRLWTLDTYDDTVDAELAAITKEYVDRLGPTLKDAQNSTSKNSRLEVEVRYSRTGLNWMSFLVQARTTYHRELIGQEIQSRTYDMTTGERIYLTDIFPEDSEGWAILREAVNAKVREYFPEEAPDETALAALLTDEGLRQLDFTLHGMSLVVHIRAKQIYTGGGYTLIEVPLYYPAIREHMSMAAFLETDNLSYYKTVALTFDDGPHRTNTTRLLNTLLETGARATFFVLGNLIKDAPDLVQREHDEGHAVGSHNFSHGDVSKMSVENIRSQKTRFDAACYPVLGISARYSRVPYGLCNDMIRARAGVALIQWSVDTYDWRDRSTATIMKNVKKQFTDGDIVLMHDIKDKTPNTAKEMIQYLQENGYMILTIDELFAKDDVTLEVDHVYYRCVDGLTTRKPEK